MLRVVVDNERVPVGREETGEPDRPSPASTTAQASMGCEVELMAVMLSTLVEAMLRTGIARPENAEALLADIADRYDSIVAGAPMELREDPEWESFSRRCAMSAAMVRAVMVDLSLGLRVHDRAPAISGCAPQPLTKPDTQNARE
jgi:hypothetical protein